MRNSAMPNTPSITNNEDFSLCRACGGECCRTRPGIEAPARFLAAANPAEELARLLASGLWVLDRHYGVPYDPGKGETGDPDRIILYPRPATRRERAEGTLLVVPGAGECVLLGDEGCTLPFAERPRACQALEPASDFACTAAWTRFDAAREWRHHQDTVEGALALLDSRQ
ncbi:hypothetical protein Gmet_2595 [Geobacter metallireducens GS-15]|uniref:Uncharacterized protein n=1 Tax=Geobacter metallireducens (strain ATCC 53774 / DSM 7210 / GS-15) TaxID=269799 RepID=Q39SG0_GEOMG|nr:hypothetical protein [Geobacter metallireducens]ABB32814.1 hypothetical protein Gmet_2595 [Geobacter metallireducens GS-15]